MRDVTAATDSHAKIISYFLQHR